MFCFRALKSGQAIEENCVQAFLASVANRLYISESSDGNSTLISTSAILTLGYVAFMLHSVPKTTESVLTILQVAQSSGELEWPLFIMINTIRQRSAWSLN